MTDEELRTLLEQSRTIAVVGHSNKPHRDSYRVGMYLRAAGYTVYPVNPSIDSVDGFAAYESLESVPERIDIVDVFRAPEHLPGVVEAAIRVRARALWTQLGVIHPAATARAQSAGLLTVVNRCIMVEHRRLLRPA